MQKNAFEIQLTDALVVMQELTISEFLRANRSADSGESSMLVRGAQITRVALAMSVVQVNGKKVSYADLEGLGWRKFLPRHRSYVQCSNYFTRLHFADDSERDAVDKTIESRLDEELDREIWAFDMPGRYGDEPVRVELREPDHETVEDSLRAASQHSKRSSAVGLIQGMEAVARSLHSIDGKPVEFSGLAELSERFSVWQSDLLRYVYGEMSGTAEATTPMGELKPVPGNA